MGRLDPGLAASATPLWAPPAKSRSTVSGSDLIWKDRTIRMTPTATAQIPPTVTIAATPGHTYQVWLWASVNSNAIAGTDFSPDQFMTITLDRFSWSVTE